MIIIWIFSGLLVTGLAYQIRFQKDYTWLSGYNSYTEEEKAELERNGYLTYSGRLLWRVALIWWVGLPLIAFRVPYGLEIFLVFFFLFIMIGSLYGTKFDIKRKRKRSAIIISLVFGVVTIGLGVLFYLGNQETEVTITSQHIEMNGMYDDKIAIKDIDELEMVEDIPSDTIKSNGFATETRSLGSFRSKEWGPGRHYVYTKYSPYIFIETKNKYFLLNSKDKHETKEWYREIEKALSSQKQAE